MSKHQREILNDIRNLDAYIDRSVVVLNDQETWTMARGCEVVTVGELDDITEDLDPTQWTSIVEVTDLMRLWKLLEPVTGGRVPLSLDGLTQDLMSHLSDSVQPEDG